MVKEVVTISKKINAPIDEVFTWFYKSENFVTSPIVFKSKWRGKSWTKGAKRDIIMIAGWYYEEITAVKENEYIQYKVNKSFPKVKQEFTQIYFESVNNKTTKVEWMIELEVPTPFFKTTFNKLGGKMAKTLYNTILILTKIKFMLHHIKTLIQ